MGAGGGLWEATDVLTAARLNQKGIFVGAAAPGSLYDGMLWYDTTYKLMKVYDNAGAAWLCLSTQRGADTTAAGTKAVSFPTAFAAAPKVFVQINDGTDGIAKISAVTAAGFTVTIRTLSTASVVDSVTSPTDVPSATENGAYISAQATDYCADTSGGAVTKEFQNYTLGTRAFGTNTHTHVVSKSTTTVLKAWQAGGAVGFDWLAVP